MNGNEFLEFFSGMAVQQRIVETVTLTEFGEPCFFSSFFSTRSCCLRASLGGMRRAAAIARGSFMSINVAINGFVVAKVKNVYPYRVRI